MRRKIVSIGKLLIINKQKIYFNRQKKNKFYQKKNCVQFCIFVSPFCNFEMYQTPPTSHNARVLCNTEMIGVFCLIKQQIDR